MEGYRCYPSFIQSGEKQNAHYSLEPESDRTHTVFYTHWHGISAVACSRCMMAHGYIGKLLNGCNAAAAAAAATQSTYAPSPPLITCCARAATHAHTKEGNVASLFGRLQRLSGYGRWRLPQPTLGLTPTAAQMISLVLSGSLREFAEQLQVNGSILACLVLAPHPSREHCRC